MSLLFAMFMEVQERGGQHCAPDPDPGRVVRYAPRVVRSKEAIGGSIQVGDRRTCAAESWCRTVN
jgi:hypothetical protein